MIDYERVWRYVVNAPHNRAPYSIHGPDHWLRVERNGCILANQTGALIHVVRLFAVFHDSRRVNECGDPGHGLRGAEFAKELRGKVYDLSDHDFDLLYHACCFHTSGYHHDNPTIGTCWDADRLDLTRVGATLDSSFMSTKFGAEIADHGSVKPWVHLAEKYIEDPLAHRLQFRQLEM